MSKRNARKREVDLTDECESGQDVDVQQKKRRRTVCKGTLSYGRKRRNVHKLTGRLRVIEGKQSAKVARSYEVKTDILTEKTEIGNNGNVIQHQKCKTVEIEKSTGSSIETCVHDANDTELKETKNTESTESRGNSNDETRQREDQKQKQSKSNSNDENGQSEDQNELLQTFFELCREEIIESLDSLLPKLHAKDVLDDFIILIKSLSEGMFDPGNIAFLLCLERCRFETLKSTTQMRYRDSTKLFWKILYRETSGKAIRLASGPKNKGCILQKSTKKGLYDPKESKSNFAVPDVKVLSTSDPTQAQLPTEIQPGLILPSLDLIPDNTDVVLLGDGKGLARGQLPGGKGDVDLFGHEEPPTKRQLQHFLDVIESNVDKMKSDISKETLHVVLKDISSLVYKLNERKVYFKKRRKAMVTKFSKENNQKSFSAGMSWVNAMDYRIRCGTQQLLAINDKVSHLIAHLDHNGEDFLNTDNDKVDVAQLSNLKLLKPIDQLDAFDLNQSCDLVKPGTEKWYQLRQEAYITADTMFNAVGFSGVKSMNEHHKLFVKQQGDEQLPVALPLWMGTLASKVVPVLLSNYTVKEVGVFYADTDHTTRFLAATPHCIVYKTDDDIVPVTFHSATLNDNYYDITNSDMCRALFEMFVLKAKSHLHVTLFPGGVIAQFIESNIELVMKILHIATDIYDKDNASDIILPKVADMTWKADILSAFDKMKSTLTPSIALPGSSVVQISHVQEDDVSAIGPYLPCAPKKICEVDTHFIEVTVKDIIDLCDTYLVDTHTLLRPQADEIFLVMATDTNRINQEGLPSQLPVAYGLKGGGMSAATLRSIMDEVKDEFHSRKTNVVCEIYDGYHHTYMERNAAGCPLYQSRLQMDTWKKFCDLGKAKLIEKIEELSTVKADLPHLAKHSRIQREWKIEGNIFILHTKRFPCPQSKRQFGMFILQSRGGPLETIGALSKLHSSTGWFSPTEDNYIDFTAETICDVLHSQEMFTQLVGNIFAKMKRQGKCPTSSSKLLVDKYITNADAMVEKFKVDHFTAVAEAVKECTGKELFRKTCKTKKQKASIVSQLFGGLGKVTGLTQNPLTLRELSKAVLMHPLFPTMQLKVALAEVYHPVIKKQWLDAAPLPMNVQVSPCGEEIQLFSYPEFDEKREKLEPKVTDPYHILTNLRKGATSGAYPELCNREAWRAVVRKKKKLLTQCIVDDCVDKQNGTIARRVFCEEVQEVMEEEGYKKTAQFVYIVRNWFEACDKRGLTADERVKHLTAMHKHLMSGVSFDTFPPPRQRIKSLPIVTFEAIMGNISTRLQLYSICRQGTYNHRAISSLAVENFFSTLASTSPTGCPKAVDIPRTISQIVSLNNYRHISPDELGFHYKTASKVTYAVHTLDSPKESMATNCVSDGATANCVSDGAATNCVSDGAATNCVSDGAATNSLSDSAATSGYEFWKNHMFDKHKSGQKSRYNKGFVTHNLKPLKGVRPVRSSFYKIDEERLDSLRRMGIQSEDLLRFGIPLEW